MKLVLSALLVVSVLVLVMPSVLNESWADSHHIPPTETEPKPKPELPPLPEPEPEPAPTNQDSDDDVELETLRNENAELKQEISRLNEVIEQLQNDIQTMMSEFMENIRLANEWFSNQLGN